MVQIRKPPAMLSKPEHSIDKISAQPQPRKCDTAVVVFVSSAVVAVFLLLLALAWLFDSTQILQNNKSKCPISRVQIPGQAQHLQAAWDPVAMKSEDAVASLSEEQSCSGRQKRGSWPES